MNSAAGKHTDGFTLAEMLIALAVAALLLASIAMAFKASAVNYQANEEMFETLNRARQSLVRITTDLRTAAVDPNAPSSQCSLVKADGAAISYVYDSDEQKLYLVQSGQNYLLCDNVTDAGFEKETATDDEGMVFVKSVQISITVAVGDDTRTLSAAAAMRRNLGS